MKVVFTWYCELEIDGPKGTQSSCDQKNFDSKYFYVILQCNQNIKKAMTCVYNIWWILKCFESTLEPGFLIQKQPLADVFQNRCSFTFNLIDVSPNYFPHNNQFSVLIDEFICPRSISNNKSSHQRYKKCVLNNFTIFTAKHLCWSLVLIKACNFIKKRVQHRCFTVFKNWSPFQPLP